MTVNTITISLTAPGSGGGGGGGSPTAIWDDVEALYTAGLLGDRGGTKKVPGVDPLPTGATYNPSAKEVKVTGADFTLSGWDFRNKLVTWSGARGRMVDCLGGRVPLVLGGGFYAVSIKPTALDLLIEFSTFTGAGTQEANLAAFINLDSSTGVYASGLTIQDCEFFDLTNDALKIGMDSTTIQRCAFVGGKNAPPTATVWSDLVTYQPGDIVVRGGTIYQALLTNTNVQPSTATASTWSTLGAPHSDVITIGASLPAGGLIRCNYFDYPASIHFLGATQVFRNVPNSGTQGDRTGRVLIEGNVIKRWQGYYPVTRGVQNDWSSGKAYSPGDIARHPPKPASASQPDLGRWYTCVTAAAAGEAAPNANPKWVLGRSAKSPAPFELRHNKIAAGIPSGTGATAVIYPPSDLFENIADGNVDYTTGQPIKLPDGYIVEATTRPQIGTVPTPAAVRTVATGLNAYDIRPTSYGKITYGGATIDACVIKVEDLIVAHITQGGAVLVYPNSDVTLVPSGVAGIWTLTIQGPQGVGTMAGTVKVVAGQAVVAAVGQAGAGGGGGGGGTPSANWSLVSRLGSTTLDPTDTDNLRVSLNGGTTWQSLAAAGLTVARGADGKSLRVTGAALNGVTPLWHYENKLPGEPNRLANTWDTGLWVRHADDPAPQLPGIAALPVMATRASTPVSTT